MRRLRHAGGDFGSAGPTCPLVPIGDTHLGRWVSRRPSLATAAGHHAPFPREAADDVAASSAAGSAHYVVTCRRSLPNGRGRCPWSHCVAGVGIPSSLLFGIQSSLQRRIAGSSCTVGAAIICPTLVRFAPLPRQMVSPRDLSGTNSPSD